MDALRAGVADNGKCEHEELLNEFPHLRFNAFDHFAVSVLIDSHKRLAKLRGSVCEHGTPPGSSCCAQSENWPG
jgi:hypothetical protein